MYNDHTIHNATCNHQSELALTLHDTAHFAICHFLILGVVLREHLPGRVFPEICSQGTPARQGVSSLREHLPGRVFPEIHPQF